MVNNPRFARVREKLMSWTSCKDQHCIMLIDISNINEAFIVIIIITITSDSVVIGLIDFHTAAAISRELAFLHNQVKFRQDFTFAF